MTKLDKPHGSKPASLTAIEGGRRQREEELLKEFLHPGVSNLRRTRELGQQLKRRGRLTQVTPPASE